MRTHNVIIVPDTVQVMAPGQNFAIAEKTNSLIPGHKVRVSNLSGFILCTDTSGQLSALGGNLLVTVFDGGGNQLFSIAFPLRTVGVIGNGAGLSIGGYGSTPWLRPTDFLTQSGQPAAGWGLRVVADIVNADVVVHSVDMSASALMSIEPYQLEDE